MTIRAENLSHHFRVHPVINDVSFSINQGELVAIMGPNGMGKSSILNCLAGILTPVKGDIYINGIRRRNSVNEEQTIRSQIAYLSDHPWLPVGRTGRQLLFDMAEVYGVETDRIFDHIERLLELFQLTEKADSNINSYSNGQKKKIALAATLVTDAPILMLDEPFTGGLDPSGIHALKEVLKHLGERSDITIVMASQIAEIVDDIADRVLVVKAGELVADGSPDQLVREVGGPDGTLSAALENLINPDTSSRISQYFG